MCKDVSEYAMPYWEHDLPNGTKKEIYDCDSLMETKTGNKLRVVMYDAGRYTIGEMEKFFRDMWDNMVCNNCPTGNIEETR